MKKPKTLLVFPPLIHFPGVASAPPIGILSIASVLEKRGYDVELIDFVHEFCEGRIKLGESVYEDAMKMMLASKADIIGLSTQCATYPPSIQLARMIKQERPETIIVFGGSNATFLAEDTLRAFPFVDYIVRGEGEYSFLELVEAIEGKREISDVSGIVYSKGRRFLSNREHDLVPQLDELPFPAYHLLASPLEYARHHPIPGTVQVLVEGGRGCTYGCYFCSNCNFFRNTVRHYSPQRLVREIEHLRDRYSINSVSFTYDLFTEDKVFLKEICDLLIRRKTGVKWKCRTRADCISMQDIDMMRDAGCYHLFFGMESGSERILRKYLGDKNIGAGARDLIRQIIGKGMAAGLSYTIGYPDETERDLEATLRDSLDYIEMGAELRFNLLSAFPGTSLYDEHKDRLVRTITPRISLGLEFSKDYRMMPSDEKLVDSHPKLFSSFYNIRTDHLNLRFLGFLNYHGDLIYICHAPILREIIDQSGLTIYNFFHAFYQWCERNGIKYEELILDYDAVLASFRLFVEGLGIGEKIDWKLSPVWGE